MQGWGMENVTPRLSTSLSKNVRRYDDRFWLVHPCRHLCKTTVQLLMSGPLPFSNRSSYIPALSSSQYIVNGEDEMTWRISLKISLICCRKILEINPGAYIFQRPFFGGAYIRRGLSTEAGNLCFKIDWASLIVERKLTVFALFFLVFEGNFQVQAPQAGRAYIWRHDLTEGFLRYEFGGPIFGGAYFRNFPVLFFRWCL